MIKYKIIHDEDFDVDYIIAITPRGKYVRMLDPTELREIREAERKCQQIQSNSN